MDLRQIIMMALLSLATINSYGQKFSDDNIKKKVGDLTRDFKVKGITSNKITNLKDYIFLDARTLKEFNTSHIKNAIYVGYDEFNFDEVTKHINKNKKIIVYCSLGYRSGKIAEKLKNNGFNVYNLLGGLFEWSNLGRELVDNQNNKTNNIHGYNKEWSKWIKKGTVKLD